MSIVPLPHRRERIWLFKAWFVTVTIVATIAGIGFLFHVHSRDVVDRLIKERLQNEAALAAIQFTGEEIEHIRSITDRASPEYFSLVWHLDLIRRQIPDIRYLYIMRRTADPMTLSFVADADDLKTAVELDRNGNGMVDTEERPSRIGDLYPINDIPALQSDAFDHPTADRKVAYDQWGPTLSGYAPIRTQTGAVIAILGLDLRAEDYISLLQSIFSIQSFLLLMLGTVLLASYFMARVRSTKADELHRLNDERAWLLQLVLHQVGTPLTAFKWGLEALKQSTIGVQGEIRTDIDDNISIMEDGVSRLQHVTDVLLAADRIQEGKMIVTNEMASLSGVVDEMVQSVLPNAAKRNQHIVVNVPKDLQVKINPRLLAGIVRELLDNAILYSPMGGTITVMARRHLASVELQVIDHGCGIPSQDLPRIFERFSRGSNAYTIDPNGTGIGLYIARGIIERFGGRIWAESIEGKGTTIAFVLPGK